LRAAVTDAMTGKAGTDGSADFGTKELQLLSWMNGFLSVLVSFIRMIFSITFSADLCNDVHGKRLDLKGQFTL